LREWTEPSKLLRKTHLVKFARLGPISLYFPEKVETNRDLAREYPRWDLELIHAKTGIFQRHIAAEGECASDLAVKAAEKLFAEHGIDRGSIDFLLLCTQTPDYPLPTTACLLQDRLGLPTRCGALDFNLGCSGFVYGLALADGLIRTGTVQRVLLITAETYSKYIDKSDRSLRTIFGDAAAATLVEACSVPSLTGFQYGTDGRGADTLLVQEGGARPITDAVQPRHRQRWESKLYMDGPELISFTMAAVPELVQQVLRSAEVPFEKVDYFLFHQATRKMLEKLQEKIGVNDEKLPISLEKVGNTVSSTIPILIEEMRESGKIIPGKRSMLVGFGVGWSWAGCLWTETVAS
jgi:3-oxoacyl-[acyl-carrier-protein] synthase III